MWDVMYAIAMFGLGMVSGWSWSRFFEYGSLKKEWNKITEEYKTIEGHYKELNTLKGRYKELQ